MKKIYVAIAHLQKAPITASLENVSSTYHTGSAFSQHYYVCSVFLVLKAP